VVGCVLHCGCPGGSNVYLRNPSEGKIRSRMLYASSKSALRVRLDGIHQEIQCTDAAELSFENVFETVAPKGATIVAHEMLKEE
jgi:Cofilin/tropomyosin-type actin-binding protein